MSSGDRSLRRGSSESVSARTSSRQASGPRRSALRTRAGPASLARSGALRSILPRLELSNTQAQLLVQRSAQARPKPRPVAKPPKAAAAIEKTYPHLLQALGDDGVERVQRYYDAWYDFHVAWERDIRPLSTSIVSSEIDRRRRLDRKLDKYRDAMAANHHFAVPMSRMLDADVHPTKSDSVASATFKERLYTELIRYPLRLEVSTTHPYMTGWKWGPHDWGMSNHDGRIRWQELMRIQKWNLDHTAILAGELVEITGEMTELRREIGGAPYDLRGKQLGEIYRNMWNTDLKFGLEIGDLGGYVDDFRGGAQVGSIMARCAGTFPVAVVKAPDDWLHVYQLKPNFNDMYLRHPDGDGVGFVLDDGLQVAYGSVKTIATKDGTSLRPHRSKSQGRGWGSDLAGSRMGAGEEFAVGAIMGDAFEDPSVSSTTGQVVIGLIPIVGQIADARDVAVGIHKIWNSGGDDGKLQTTLAIVGFIPGIGDLVKGAFKSGGKKAVAETMQRMVPKMERALAEGITKNPRAAAEAFGVTEDMLQAAHKVAEDAQGMAAKGLSSVAERSAYLTTMSSALDEVGGNAGALVALTGGSWAKTAARIKALTKSTDPGLGLQADLLAARMTTWRTDFFEKTMMRDLASDIGDLRVSGSGRIGPPKGSAPGTKDITSDLDWNFAGPNSSVYRNAAERYLAERFGPTWRSMLDADVFSDATRMHAMMDVPVGRGLSKASKKQMRLAEKELARISELNVLAKMVRSGTPEVQVKRYAASLGVDWGEIAARKAELDELARPLGKVSAAERTVAYWQDKVAGAVHQAQRKQFETQVRIAKDNLGYAREALSRSPLRKLELQMDALHARFAAAKTGSAKLEIAKEMARTQSKLNAVGKGAYLTPGGVYTHVTYRESLLNKTKRLTAPTEMMRYTAALDDLLMIEKTKQAFVAEGFTADVTKDLAKYADRLIASGAQLGTDTAWGLVARGRFQTVADTLLMARANKERVTADMIVKPFRQALGDIGVQLNAFVKEAKKNGLSDLEKMYVNQATVIGELALLARRAWTDSERKKVPAP